MWLYIVVAVIALLVLIVGLSYYNTGGSGKETVSPIPYVRQNTTGAGTVASSSSNGATNKKAVALLELTGGDDLDTTVGISLTYIANLNGWPITIVDTASSISNTLSLLQSYYDQGYRAFIGFGRSTVLEAVLPWFQVHQDTIGVSPFSTASSLAVQKNVIRLQPSDVFNSYFMAHFIDYKNYENVYFVVQQSELAATDLRTSISNQIPASLNTVTVLVGDLTYDQTSRNAVVTMLQSIQDPVKSVIVPLVLGNGGDVFRKLVTDTLAPAQIPDILDTIDVEPTFDSVQSSAYNNKYYFLTVNNIQSLSNVELNQILGANFNLNAYDSYNIVRNFCTRPVASTLDFFSAVDHQLGHTGSLELNNFNDRKYSFFNIQQWHNQVWTPFVICGNSENTGIFISEVIESQQSQSVQNLSV